VADRDDAPAFTDAITPEQFAQLLQDSIAPSGQ
jgi:hypothetical protein